MFPNYPLMLAGRFVGGLGVGACSMLAPQFLSENAPKSVRGSMVGLDALRDARGPHADYHKGLLLQPLHHPRSHACLLDQLCGLTLAA